MSEPDNTAMDALQLTSIGEVISPYTEKFAIPRQPGLVTAAKCSIKLSPACNREEILRGLEGFSHIWILFGFHKAIKTQWKPMVRPPRLGGNDKVGVFASRSPFRPNPIGMSAVKLSQIVKRQKVWHIEFEGGDILNGTPVFDIKPYLPYADAITEATGSYAQEIPSTRSAISFAEQALTQLERLNSYYANLPLLIQQILSQYPQPAYQKDSNKEFGMTLYDLNIRWRQSEQQTLVLSISQNKA